MIHVGETVLVREEKMEEMEWKTGRQGGGTAKEIIFPQGFPVQPAGCKHRPSQALKQKRHSKKPRQRAPECMSRRIHYRGNSRPALGNQPPEQRGGALRPFREYTVFLDLHEKILGN